jgi:uncharacterized protein with FMN-binding domain
MCKRICGGGSTTDWFNEIVNLVIEAQDTQVDTVSGATVTSKAYLSAIEDAFNRQTASF